MGEIKKQGISNTIITLIGAIIGAINTMVLFPKIMPKEYFGLTRLLLEVAFIFGQIGLLGMGTGIIKYWNEVKKPYSLFRFALGKTAINGLIIVVILFLFEDVITDIYKDKSPLFTSSYSYVYILFIVLAFFELFSALSSAMLKSTVPIFLKDIVLRLYISLSILAYHLDLITKQSFIFIFVLGYVFILAIIIFYTTFQYKNVKRGKLDKSIKNKFKVYSRASFLTGLSSGVVNRLDVLMIPMLIVNFGTVNGGLGAVGIYSLALYVSNVLEIPSRSFFAISTPIIAKSWTNNDHQSILSIYKKTSINLTLIALFMFLVLIINLDDLLSFLPSDYLLAKPVIIILGISKVFNMLLGTNNIILGLSPYYKVLTVVMVVLIFLTTVFNYIFIPSYGILGAAYGTVLSLVIYNLVSYLFLYYKYNIQPLSLKTLTLFSIGLAVYFIISFVSIQNIYLSIIIKSGLFTALYAILVYRFNISEDINGVVDKTLAKVFKKG